MTTKNRLFTGVLAFAATALTFAVSPAAAAPDQSAPANDSSLNGATTGSDPYSTSVSSPSTGGAGLTSGSSQSGFGVNDSSPTSTGGAGSTSGSSESGLEKSQPASPSSLPANDASTGDRARSNP